MILFTYIEKKITKKISIITVQFADCIELDFASLDFLLNFDGIFLARFLRYDTGHDDFCWWWPTGCRWSTARVRRPTLFRQGPSFLFSTPPVRLITTPCARRILPSIIIDSEINYSLTIPPSECRVYFIRGMGENRAGAFADEYLMTSQ